MSRRMKKNGFVEGAIAAYISIIVIKLLGALYGIPFYNIIGESGGVIYSCAYNVYSLLLDISTSGIPVAMSILISEYSSLGKYHSEKRAYSLGLKMIGVLSIVTFAALQLFAPQLERFFLADMTEGVAAGTIETAIRVISVCLLVVPFLSLRRGYLQGHKFIAASSTSQVVEQVVRIAVVLLGSYVAVSLLHQDTSVGVYIALCGASVGAIAAIVYLHIKSRGSAELFAEGECTEAEADSHGEILRRILGYCLTIVIVSITNSIYNLVDQKMLLMGLHDLHYSDADTQAIASIASTWIPKISMILVALPMGLTNSIAPHMAESYAAGDNEGVNFKYNQAIGTLIVLLLPMATGLIVFAEPVYRLFYGASPYGTLILQFSAIINTLGAVTTVSSMTLQSVNRGKAVCVFTVIGVVTNAALDLPLIYLCNSVGIPAYLGASFASVIGQALTILLLMLYLKKSLYFRFGAVGRILVRTILPTAVMGAVVVLLKSLWTVADGRGIPLIAQLCVYAAVGAAVYIPLAFVTKAIPDVFGADILQKLLAKLPFGKSSGGTK